MKTEIVSRPPSVPSKWDVIPVHGSDISNYKRCRRYWDWTSPTRNNLRRRVDIHGVSMPLFFGTGIHYALEMYYDPILQRDPVESFLTWYNFQWEGGIVGEEWLERTYDVHPRFMPATYETGRADLPEWTGFSSDEQGYSHTMTPELWQIKGLKEMLPNLEVVQEEFEYHKELGVGMMTFYRDYAERNDDFVVVAAESVFSIPLGFMQADRRPDSPNEGKMLEVHARGKRDAIIYYPEMDKFGIIDHKTAAIINDDYFRKLDKDEQCSTYLWATIQEAQYNDLPWKGHVVDRVVYNAVRKNFPQPPIITSHGYPSLDRQKQSTTAELFQAAVVGNENLEHWFQTNEKAQAYYTYLCEQGDSLFVQRDLVRRNQHEIESTGTHIRMVAQEMLNDPYIYPSPSGSFQCLQCAFRSPCIAADDGSDWVGMLADGYEQNRDR